MDPFSTVTNLIISAGALGTAAFGLVEAAKGTTPLGLAGIGRLKEVLGTTSLQALQSTYGEAGWDYVLKGAYRKGSESLTGLLRNGLRVALDGPQGEALAQSLNLKPGAIGEALQAFRTDQATGGGADEAALQAQRRTLGLAELALDARVEGAVAIAEDARVGWMQFWAGAIAVLGAMSVAALTAPGGQWWGPLGKALLLGLVAVPIAPLSKDLVSFLKTAKDAVGRR